MLPPGTQSTRGNEGTITKISGNLIKNEMSIVSFNSALSRTIIIIIIIIIYLFTASGLSPGDSGYFTCKQNTKLVTTKFKSGGLNEKHVVATWNLWNHLSICF